MHVPLAHAPFQVSSDRWQLSLATGAAGVPGPHSRPRAVAWHPRAAPHARAFHPSPTATPRARGRQTVPRLEAVSDRNSHSFPFLALHSPAPARSVQQLLPRHLRKHDHRPLPAVRRLHAGPQRDASLLACRQCRLPRYVLWLCTLFCRAVIASSRRSHCPSADLTPPALLRPQGVPRLEAGLALNGTALASALEVIAVDVVQGVVAAACTLANFFRLGNQTVCA
jgi:hypothetical protein